MNHLKTVHYAPHKRITHKHKIHVTCTLHVNRILNIDNAYLIYIYSMRCSVSGGITEVLDNSFGLKSWETEKMAPDS